MLLLPVANYYHFYISSLRELYILALDLSTVPNPVFYYWYRKLTHTGKQLIDRVLLLRPWVHVLNFLYGIVI